MTTEQALTETKHLADLFPRANNTQLAFWAKAFEKYQQPLIRRAIVEYAGVTGDFIDRTELRAVIENLHGNGPIADTPETRAKAIADELRRNTSVRQREQKLADDSFARVNAALDGIGDRELQALKDEVLSEVDETTAVILHLSDPKTGKALRTMMARHLEKRCAI